MFCKNCGAQMKESAGFCQFCGSQVGATVPTAASTQFPEQNFSQSSPDPAYAPDPVYGSDPAYQPDPVYNPPPAPYPAYGMGLEPPPKRPFYKRWWFWVITVVLLLIVGLFALIGIGFRHIEHIPAQPGDHALVGIWEWEDSTTYLYVFNADGTGSRGFAPLIQRFEWEIDAGGHLILELRGYAEIITYSISGNRLTLNHRGGNTYRYTRRTEAAAALPSGDDTTTQPQDNNVTETLPDPDVHEETVPASAPGDAHPLVGTWAYDENQNWRYFFFPDGTGARGAGSGYEFEWRVEDGNRLYITFASAAANRTFRLREERWTYTIADGTLTLDSRQDASASFSYIWVE